MCVRSHRRRAFGPLGTAVALAAALAWQCGALAQEPRPEGIGTRLGAPEPYRESALRRFEIVTLTALPFTAIHSYLVVRGYRAAKAGNLATGLAEGDWNVVGVGAVAFAVSIGLYDYMRMRGKDRTAPLLPEPAPAPTMPESQAPDLGGLQPLAQLAWRF